METLRTANKIPLPMKKNISKKEEFSQAIKHLK